MAVAKVIYKSSANATPEVWMDATTATAAAADITSPKTAMLADGVVTTGTGTVPTGTKSISITENGTTTEDVTNYASAEITVDVQGGGGYTIEEIATNSAFYQQNLILPPSVTVVADGAFSAKRLASVSGVGVVEVGKKAFAADGQVGRPSFTFDFPALEIAKQYAFANNDMGNQMAVVNAFTCYSSLFEGCVNLPSVKYTRPTNIEGDQIYNIPTVTTIIINSTPTTISNIAFRRATGLTDIYVPWSEGAVANAPWGATTATIHYDTVFDANGDPT